MSPQLLWTLVDGLLDGLHHLVRLIDEVVGTQVYVLLATVPKEFLECVAEAA